MCINSSNPSISNQINNSYFDNKVNKLYQQDRPVRFFLGKEACISDKIKCWVVNTVPCFAPKSWKQRLIQQADIIRYRTTNRSKLISGKVSMPKDHNQSPLTRSSTGLLWMMFKDSCPIEKEQNDIKVEYKIFDCDVLCKLYKTTDFGKDKFCNTDTITKFVKYCQQNKDIIDNILFSTQNSKPAYTKLFFNSTNFRNILTNIVEKVAEQEDKFKMVCRFNIAFKCSGETADHPMVLRFIKKQYSVVIALFDSINSIDTARFIVKNKDAISQLQYKDFFPTRFQRAIYQLNCNNNRISTVTEDLDKLNLTSCLEPYVDVSSTSLFNYNDLDFENTY